MGPTGPCGPCTEIFYDHGDHISGGPPGSPMKMATGSSRSGTSFSCRTSSSRTARMAPLDMQSIDTGMGLERIGALLQGKHDNYDTDLMRGLIEASRACDQRRPGRAGQDASPGDCGSSALDLFPDRRWGDAVERRARLCAAPDHAPRDAACASAGREGSVDAPAGAGAGPPDGAGLSRTGPRAGADRGDAAAGGNPVQADAGSWSEAAG